MDETRVLRLIARLNIGGPARQALLLTKQLRDTYPTVLAAGTPPAYEGELSDPDVPVTHVPMVRDVSPLKDVGALKAVRGLIHSLRPDLLHTHTAKAGALGRIAALTVRDRPKLVHTFHGHVLEGYFSTSKQKTFIAVERFLARRTDALVAVSDEVRDSLLELGIGTAERFRVIPLGFDLNPFRAVGTERPGRLRDAIGVTRDTRLIGVVGRLAPIKDHATLFEAMAFLPGVHLAVIGDGELRAELEAKVRDLNLARRVHFAGWWPDVANAIADLDVTVLSSRNEGTPVSLIESLAAGRPVVATDVGGVRSVVKDGENGYLVPAGDARALAARVQELLDSPLLGEAFGSAGRERVLQRFDQKRLITDITALYDSLLS